MNIIRLASLTLGCLVFAGSAHAQLVVQGKSGAAQCYEFAIAGNEGTRAAITTCSDGLEEVISQKDRAATYVNRGLLYMRQGDQEKATADYEAALAIRPNLTQAYVNRGASLIRQKKFDEAIVSLNTALEDMESPTRAAALYNRAIARDWKQDYRGAYFDLKSALVIRPDWDAALDLISRYEVRSSG